jgi:NADPH-dependent 2,4-dienoyl-CoA reductase/sulfur reductase-like enzyme
LGSLYKEFGLKSSFDLVVVGGGVGGVNTALTAKRAHPPLSVAVVSHKPLTYPRPDLAAFLRNPSKFGKIERYGVGELEASGIRLFEGCRVTSVNHENRMVHVENTLTGEKFGLEFSKMVLATGSLPAVPPVEGCNLPGVFTIKWYEDVLAISNYIASGMRACVVGAGIIGLEVAEALKFRGLKVMVVEALPFILGGFIEPDLAEKVAQNLSVHGVNLVKGSPIEGIHGKGKVEYVLVGGEKFEADLVVLAVGLRPNTSLASQMGLRLSKIGAIKTDRLMRSSLEEVYAVGDDAETIDYVTGKAVYRPLGSIAAKAAEIAGLNIAGTREAYDGFIRVQYDKLFGISMGSLGLTVREAQMLGVSAKAVDVSIGKEGYPSLFLPAKAVMKAVVERGSDMIIGWQIVDYAHADAWTYWNSQLFLKAIQERLTLSQLQEVKVN